MSNIIIGIDCGLKGGITILDDKKIKVYKIPIFIEQKNKNSKKKSKSAVDFENILTKLEKRIEDMCVLSTYGDQDANCLVTFPLEDTRFDFNWSNQQCWTLKKNFGMGSVTYTDDQRNALAM